MMHHSPKRLTLDLPQSRLSQEVHSLTTHQSQKKLKLKSEEKAEFNIIRSKYERVDIY